MPSAAFVGRASAAVDDVLSRPPPAPWNAVQAASAAASNSVATLRIGHRPQALVVGSPERQPNLEMGAGLAVSHELHGAAVSLHALGYHRQADAGSADGASLGPPALIKGLEDSVAVLGMHAWTIVADVHDEIVALHSATDVNRAAARSELDGVRQQILEHKLELPFVG